jgi:hypothetical protein
MSQKTTTRVTRSPYRYIPLISPTYRRILKVYRNIKYSGRKVFCPLCEKHFSAWVKYEEHGSCPSCGSECRHRLLWLLLQSQNRILNQRCKLLHFAPEPCLQNKFKAQQNIEYTTADLSAPRVDVYTDITNLVFEDNSFEAIICCHVLEHIPDDKTAMREIFRVLSSDGIAYIQVPYKPHELTDEDPNVTDPKEREKRFGQFDHVRVYGFDLKERLESVGFKVDIENYAQKLNPQDTQRYGLWDDVIFCCTKA